jgi:alanine racemase
MENSHVTKLEIDVEALESNLNYFKSKILPSTKVLVVLKAFAYGSSSVAIARTLESKVDYFAVAYSDEGIALKNAAIETPIIVFHPQKINLEKILLSNLEPAIYSLPLLEEFLKITRFKGVINFPIHLKFNTGLNRLGFKLTDIPQIAKLLKGEKSVKVSSIFSHIAASEDLNEAEFTRSQIQSFQKITAEFSKSTGLQPMKHLLNTSGIINYAKEAQFDMVRLGIGLYGFDNLDKETKTLKNVLTLKSVISQIHPIEKGASVGYNRRYKATTSVNTATIPVGHADGISRRLGNGVGYVFINDQKAPIIGTVCMDMIMVDITKIDCVEGDEVVVYKNQKHMKKLAQAIQTIPYELLTAISQRIRRVLKKC